MEERISYQHHEIWLENWQFHLRFMHDSNQAVYVAVGKLQQFNPNKLTILHEGAEYDLTSLPITVRLNVGAVSEDSAADQGFCFLPAYNSRDGEYSHDALVQIELRTDAPLSMDTVKGLNTLDVRIEGVKIIQRHYDGTEGTIDENIKPIKSFSFYTEDRDLIPEPQKPQIKLEDLKKTVTYLGYGLALVIGLLVYKLFH